VPEISRFFVIVIAMYYRDHAPPHFHAIYGEFEITIAVESGTVTGKFPAPALALVQGWRRTHQAELLESWQLARAGQPLPRIRPLE
jgi:hypothetical protein